MRKTIYTTFCLLLLVFPFQGISAQTPTCSSDFTVKITTTPSTCQSNGTVTVTLEGDLSNIFNVQYGLSVDGGFTINPQASNVLTGVPSGTYNVTVRAFCRIDDDFDAIKTVSNVVVGGDYKVPQLTFNANKSRKSYPSNICNTGVIVLTLTNGNGDFTFNIVSAPSGVTLGEVTPTKIGYDVYALPTNDYPSGDYVITADDGCYLASCSFTLGVVPNFPTFAYTNYTGFSPASNDPDCKKVRWTAGTIYQTNPDHYRYYLDGMYEVGLAPFGEMPAKWTTWNAYTLELDIGDHTFPELYYNNGNTLSIYTRLKGCETGYTSINTYIPTPYPWVSNSVYCDYYSSTIRPWTDRDGIICYPYSVQVINTTTQTTVLTKENIAQGGSVNVALDYDNTYEIIMKDANEYVMTRVESLTPPSITISYVNYTDNYCSDQFLYTYYLSTTCYPTKSTIKDSAGNIVYTKSSIVNQSGNGSCYLKYNQKYTLEVEFIGTNIIETRTIERTTTIPSSYYLGLNGTSSCYEDNGSLYVYAPNGSSPPGTTITIIGPEGYTSQSITTAGTSGYHYFSNTYLPAGTYTATIVHGCGDQTPMTATLAFNGVYSGRQLDYTSETTCSGLKITPTGYVTYQGANRPASTYYRLMSGPPGDSYDKSVIAPGGSITLSQPGIYTLGITTINSATGCALNTKTIEYTAPPMEMDPNVTSAYVCVNSNQGVMILKARNGVAPYKYELWNADNTVKITEVADQTSNDRVYFEYGGADETYTIRVTDGCGNSFKHEVTLANLSTARIVYSLDNEMCEEGSVRLRCITLGETQYHWTGPNGFESFEQNPVLTNVTPDMSGQYKVSVKPEFCGDPVEDEIDIKIHPKLVAGASSSDQEVCTRITPAELSSSATGGKGNHTYQWQSSGDGGQTWNDVIGATGTTYTPPSQLQSGEYLYRRATTDSYCGTVYSSVMTVNVKSCHIPVNPHLINRVK